MRRYHWANLIVLYMKGALTHLTFIQRRNEMKKLITTIICIAIIFSLSVPAFAANSSANPVISDTVQQTVVNEYEAILQLQKCSLNELSKNGYSDSEIKIIKNADDLFDNHIALLATLSDDRLATAGYTSEQIAAIKSYDAKNATESDKVRLSANCVTKSSIDNYTGYTGRVTSTFKWTGIPAFKMTDVLITTWNNWELKGKTANIKYTHINGTKASFWRTPTYQTPSSGMTSYGSGYSYSAALEDNAYYASEGYSIFVLSSKSMSHLETISRVSHQQGIASLSFSISSGFDIGISIGRKLLGNGHALKS